MVERSLQRDDPADAGLLDGKYRVGRELSRGGMGRVHVATHVHLGTEVAIKILHDDRGPSTDPDHPDSQRTRHNRFLQEARAAAQLRHPNVVQVLDYGIDRDRPYLVMELLDGETLGARLERDGALGAADTCAVVNGIAAALTAAHAAGIVHRDLKPDNVFLITADGRLVVKVLDFGVAKVAAAPAVVTTASGAVLGTPAYMSPEQAQGARDVDAASDRWALGVIAFECLVGRRPFTAESLGELVLQICAWSPPVPSQHADVPDGFDAWFASACHRDRAARFATAAEQAAALTRICGSTNVLTRPILPMPEPTRAARPVRAPDKGPRALGFRGVIAAVMVSTAVLGIAIRVLRPAPVSDTPAAQPSAIDAVAPAPADQALRIAVLPFDAPSDSDLASLADVATEEMIARLAGRTGLRVIARASVMRLRGAPPPDLARTAAELGANRLLIGHMSRTATGVRVALELIDPRDQTVAWTRTYTRPDAELESVCSLAASDLAAELGAPRQAERPLRAPAAYRAYRTGRAYWARRDHANLTQAIRYFEDALRLDPDYAAAWVGLVDADLLLPWVGPTPRMEAYARARIALERALELEPNSSEVQAALGNLLLEADWQFAAAERAYRRAIEIDPDNASAHQWLGETIAMSRRFDESLAEFDLALQLDPLTPAIHKARSSRLYFAGRFADAIEAAERALALDSTQPFALYTKGYALVELGRFDDGLAAIVADPMFQVPGARPFVAVQELWVASRRGDRATVARLRAEVERSTLGRDGPFTAGFAAAIVGDREAMLTHLERAFADHDPWAPLIALNHEFDPYRREPRFIALIERLGLLR